MWMKGAALLAEVNLFMVAADGPPLALFMVMRLYTDEGGIPPPPPEYGLLPPVLLLLSLTSGRKHAATNPTDYTSK